jgi:hypothetical protein
VRTGNVEGSAELFKIEVVTPGHIRLQTVVSVH